jgi:GAF domain-containing protein
MVIRRLRHRWYALAAMESEELPLAGLLSGVLYMTGATTLALLLVLPDVTTAHWPYALALAGAAGAWGLISALWIDWHAAPGGLIHVSNSAGFAVIGAAIALTGGYASPAWVYLFFIVVFSSYFYTPRVAAVYLGGCCIVQLLPLIYDGSAVQGAFIAETMIAVPAYVALGGAVIAGKQLTIQMRTRAELLATEQGALRRVATAIADGRSAEAIYALVAEEVAHLLNAGAAGILRFSSEREAVVIGSWSDHPGGRYPPSTVVPVRPGSDVERALRSGRAVRVDENPPGSPVDRLGYACSVVSPVHVDGKVWGILAVTDARPAGLPADAEQRLEAFGDLLGTSISNTETREQLALRASTDPLTGLANHRAFHERLAGEVARAVRYRRELSVAVIDVDHFKQINDAGGHELGDRILAELAELLRGIARAEDTLAASWRARASRSRRGSVTRRRRTIPSSCFTSPTAPSTGARSTAATSAGSMTAMSSVSCRRRSAPSTCSARRRCSACGHWRGRSTPRTRPPGAIPSASPTWPRSWR